jgi:hypothetical protein
VDEATCRRIVYERSGGVCEIGLKGICLGRGTNISHRKARGQGGPWSPANCMHACGSGTTGCHGWVEANWTEAERRGLRVSAYDDFIGKPVVMRTAVWLPAWWILNEDGTLTWDESLEERPV